jgi:integrase
MEMRGFVGELRKRGSVAALGLEFAILTAARTGEVLGAHLGEIDFGQAVWTVPAERMKAGREHRVPLSSRAMDIIKTMKSLGAWDYIFPGLKQGRPLSCNALKQVMQRMKVPVTVHGFRSSFRDWAAECTDHPNEVVEMALAHTVSNAVERAYRRGDLLEKRRRLMEDWATFCEPRAAEVVDITSRRA